MVSRSFEDEPNFQKFKCPWGWSGGGDGMLKFRIGLQKSLANYKLF